MPHPNRTLTVTKINRMTTQNTPTTDVLPLAPLIVARRAPLLMGNGKLGNGKWEMGNGKWENGK